MLQNYFNQYKKRGTSTTDLLEEKERILGNLATVTDDKPSPSASISITQGGILITQPKSPSASLSAVITWANASGVTISSGNRTWTLATEQVFKPSATTEAITFQSKIKSENERITYNMVHKSFENFKKKREEYTLRRQKEVMSFLDDDDE